TVEGAGKLRRDLALHFEIEQLPLESERLVDRHEGRCPGKRRGHGVSSSVPLVIAVRRGRREHPISTRLKVSYVLLRALPGAIRTGQVRYAAVAEILSPRSVPQSLRAEAIRCEGTGRPKPPGAKAERRRPRRPLQR